MGNMSRMTAARGDSVKQPRKPVAGFALGGGIGDANLLDNPLLALMGGQGGQDSQRRQDLSPLQKLDQSVAMGNAMGELSNTERYQISNPTNAAYGIGGPAPGSSAAASMQRQQTDIQSTLRDKLSQQPLYQQGFADGGKPETAEELLARLSGKYGVGNKSTPQPAPQQAPQPVQQPATNPGIGHGIVNILKGRKEQIDKASGYANGGKIKGPGTPTSDSIDASVKQTGEPIKVSTDERILSKAQDVELSKIASDLGFPSLDAWLETMTGKPVGPTMKGGKRAAGLGQAPKDIKREEEEAANANVMAERFDKLYGSNPSSKPVVRNNKAFQNPAVQQAPAVNEDPSGYNQTDAAMGQPEGSQGAPGLSVWVDQIGPAQAAMAQARQQAAQQAEQKAQTAPQAEKPAVAGAQQAQPAPYDVQDTGQAGIKRVNAKGKNPLFTNADPAAAVQQMAGMKSGSIQMGGGEKDPGWINDAYGNDMRPTIAMKNQLAQMERDRYGRDMQADIKDPRVIAAAALNLQRMNQGAATETAQQSAGVDNRMKQNALAQSDQMRAVLDELNNPKTTPERRAALTKSFRLMNNKDPASRFVVIPGGEYTDPANPINKLKEPSRLFNTETEQPVAMGGNQAAMAGPTRAQYEAQIRAKNPGIKQEQIDAGWKQYNGGK